MKSLIPAILITLAAGSSALALPQMDITQAKGTLTNRENTPTAVEFKSRRVKDRPSFDKLGIGNYFTEYRLDNGQKLMVWMYVESAPPTVDEVVVYIYPAQPKDLSYQRALKLLQVVYGESRAGAKVVADFQEARSSEVLNQYKLQTMRYGANQSLLPASHDGGLYYLGKSFGYKVSYNKGGLEVVIHRKDYWQKFVMDLKKRRYPDPKPPAPAPTPLPPAPTPNPKIVW